MPQFVCLIALNSTAKYSIVCMMCFIPMIWLLMSILRIILSWCMSDFPLAGEKIIFFPGIQMVLFFSLGYISLWYKYFDCLFPNFWRFFLCDLYLCILDKWFWFSAMLFWWICYEKKSYVIIDSCSYSIHRFVFSELYLSLWCALHKYKWNQNPVALGQWDTILWFSDAWAACQDGLESLGHCVFWRLTMDNPVKLIQWYAFRNEVVIGNG